MHLNNISPSTIIEKIKNIRFLLSDVDGVLTDGSLYIGSDGTEYKKFHVEDHAGVALCRFGGIDIGLLSARFSESTSIRAKEMNINICIQGTLNKVRELKQICRDNNIKENEVAYVGDGLIDIPVMDCVGLAISVNNADEQVKSSADIVTEKEGGQGALKEIVNFILKKQGKYDSALKAMREKVYES